MQTEYEAETLWIPRKYEVVRLGTSVYPVCREVPYQTTDVEAPFSNFNLSTFGSILTSRLQSQYLYSKELSLLTFNIFTLNIFRIENYQSIKVQFNQLMLTKYQIV